MVADEEAGRDDGRGIGLRGRMGRIDGKGNGDLSWLELTEIDGSLISMEHYKQGD